MNIDEVIAKEKAEAAKKLAEAERLKRLHEAFPDLQRYVGRWNKVAYYSKAVNARITDADVRYNCGCCNDSPLEVWPFIETADGHVYSDPPYFRVGERDTWSGTDQPYPGWDETMLAADIPRWLIEKVGLRFKSDDEDAGDDT